MNALSLILFVGAGGAVFGRAMVSNAPLVAASAALLGLSWLALGLNGSMTRSARSVLLGCFAATVVVAGGSPVSSVCIIATALAAWHLGNAACEMAGVGGGKAKRRLIARQMVSILAVIAASVGFATVALGRSFALPFWGAVGLGAAALLLSGLWVAAARDATAVAADEATASEEIREPDA